MSEPNTFRILVIDDNPNIHQDFRKILCNRIGLFPSNELKWRLEDDFEEVAADSYEVDCAIQGQIGVEMAKAAAEEGRPFSVAFVDMRMPPGWDGLETVEHLWKIDPCIQVVFVTAYTTYTREDIQSRLGNTGRLLFVKKPFDIIEIEQFTATLTKKWSDEKLSADKIESLEREISLLKGVESVLPEDEEDPAAQVQQIIDDVQPLLKEIVEQSGDLLDKGTESLTHEQMAQALSIQQNGNEVLARLAPISDEKK